MDCLQSASLAYDTELHTVELTVGTSLSLQAEWQGDVHSPIEVAGVEGPTIFLLPVPPSLVEEAEQGAARFTVKLSGVDQQGALPGFRLSVHGCLIPVDGAIHAVDVDSCSDAIAQLADEKGLVSLAGKVGLENIKFVGVVSGSEAKGGEDEAADEGSTGNAED